MDKLVFEAGIDAVHEIATEIEKAVAQAIARHGQDPNIAAIISAAFCMAIDNTSSKVDPTIRIRVMRQLAEMS